MADSLNVDSDDLVMKSHLDPTLTPPAVEIVVCESASPVDEDLRDCEAECDITAELEVRYVRHNESPRHSEENQLCSFGETMQTDSNHCLSGVDECNLELVKVEQSEKRQSDSSHVNSSVPSIPTEDITSEQNISFSDVSTFLDSPSLNILPCLSDQSVILSDSSHLRSTLKTIAKHELQEGKRALTVVHPVILHGVQAVSYLHTSEAISDSSVPEVRHPGELVQPQTSGTSLKNNQCISSAVGSTVVVSTTPSFLIRPSHSDVITGARHVQYTTKLGTINTARNSSVSSTNCHKRPDSSMNLDDSTVPDVVAMETVVTTDEMKKHKFMAGDDNEIKLSWVKDQTSEMSEENLPSQESIQNVTCDTSQIAHEILITPATTTRSKDDVYDCGDQQCIAIVPVPEPSGEHVIVSSRGTEVQKCISKRERDKLKKRERRSQPEYREKEKESARERMRKTRANPEYRDNERLKDKFRRRQYRLNNPLARARERERDKQHKRVHRLQTSGKQVVTVNSLDEVTDGLIF